MKATTVDRTTQLRAEFEQRRAAIHEHLRALQADLSAATRSQGEEGTLANHPADEGSDMFFAESVSRRMDDLRAELTEIDTALARIERGSWGICEECGAEIDPERMEALPSATRCIGCQRRHE